VDQSQCQPQQRRQLLDASPELQDLLPEFRRREVRHVHRHHDSRRRTEPSTRGRAWDPEIGRDGQVPGALDEIPEPMVIALLGAGRGRHPEDDRPFADTAQLLRDHGERRSARDENSRTRIRNVDGDSSAFPRRVAVRKEKPRMSDATGQHCGHLAIMHGQDAVALRTLRGLPRLASTAARAASS
jgi:hypothetical protein